jgi:uncharacterized protein YecT (DUF1311 family)
MTRNLVVFLLALAVPVIAIADDSAADPCAKDHVAYAKCLGAKLSAADEEVERAFQVALAELPESDSEDTRKGRAQLRKAQEAWRAFANENCAYVGGLEGGSSLWVTTSAMECQLKEDKKRIAFFHNPQ